jgi:trans-2,3-dihydro-3-hydroxyanthranilate isomerase
MDFHIVDVFADGPYTGNQLAVFRCRSLLSDEVMQHIAREMNFAESTFILSEKERQGGYEVRIFTPAQEIDFAGHPTLGTAHILSNKIAQRPLKQITLNLKVGPTVVDLPQEKGEALWMKQIAPVFGWTLEAKALAGVLNLPIEAFDERFPIHEVSTGLPHIIIPLRSLDYLKKARVDLDEYYRLIEKTWAKNLLVFCPEGRMPGHDLSARMFADYLGVPEDPATGSGNGCLAGYLVKHRFLGSASIDLCVGQGHEIGRPSLLYLRAAERGGEIDIAVGGRVVEIAEGKWRSGS